MLGNINKWPYGSATFGLLFQPLCCLRCHPEGACPVLVPIELCEDPRFRPIQAIVAKDVALARPIADRNDGIPIGERWSRGWRTR